MKARKIDIVMNRNTYPSPWEQNEKIFILFSSKQLPPLPLAVNANRVVIASERALVYLIISEPIALILW